VFGTGDMPFFMRKMIKTPLKINSLGKFGQKSLHPQKFVSSYTYAWREYSRAAITMAWHNVGQVCTTFGCGW